MRSISIAAGLLMLLTAGSARAEDGSKLYLRGSGWFQFGQILHSSDTLNPLYNYNGNWQQNSGAQFTVVADIDEHLQGAMGLGGFQTHTPQGAVDATAQAGLVFNPYITEARFTYFGGERAAPAYLLDFGFFPFQPSRDNRNLGAYLLRGPVYPGILFSEFEAKSLDMTVANILGAHAQHNIGQAFTHDFLVRSEIEFPPVFDMSLIYLATLRFGRVFEIGGGANFYRALAMQPRATKLDKRDFQIEDPRNVAAAGEKPHPYLGNYAYIDTVTGDTTMLSHQGIKLMGRFSLDAKTLFGIEGWASMDLKLFAEAAVIGIKDYPGVYPDIKERIPLMVGFGIPTFGLLDECVLEVEQYKAPFRDDYRRLMSEASPIPMNNKKYEPVRVEGQEGDVYHMTQDDLKWSLYMARTFGRSMKLSLQAANDHYRPITHLNANPTQVERLESAFTTTKDWYLMFRIGFFFN